MKNLLKQPSIKYTSIVIISLAVLMGGYFLIPSSSSSSSENYVEKEIDEAFSEYISAYTTGDVSVKSKLRIRFTQRAIEDSQIETEEKRELFSFSPSVKGKAIWIDAYTIEYIPNEWLNSDAIFDVRFDLSQLFKTSDELALFEFNFHTIRQDYEVILGDLITSADNMKKVSLTGTLNTADAAIKENIETTLTATQDGNLLNITWNHLGDTEHEFYINDINRKEKEGKVVISWKGNEINVEKEGSSNVKIPALGDFYVISSASQYTTDPFVVISFSDPIDPNQDLTGFITNDKNIAFKFTIENNQIKAYPNRKIVGTFNLTVHKGIKNVLGYKMKKEHKSTHVFEQVNPAVRLVGNGNIVPSSNGLVFPFEAVSLKAVDVTIIEIFENNAVQFFQTNRIDGSNQLKRVARPVFKKSLKLDQNKLLNLGKWNRYSIDLAKLITPTPGAIYQVQIGFRQSQSTYACGGSDEAKDQLTPIKDENWTAESYTDYSYWDYYEGDYNSNYEWSERDNPCHVSYFMQSNRVIKRNIIASNLGVITKIGKDRKVVIAVTDITTTKPLEGVTVEIYDFQQQIIATGETDSKGFLTLEVIQKPFLLKAKQHKDVSYLKLDEGSALSLSNFNVGGSTVKKGIKGFIYGERGVWRPGDTLFLTFILEDKNHILPKNHPVTFELLNPDGKVENKIVKHTNVKGFYTYQPTTEEEDPTGNWQVKVKVGNTSFTERVKIEAIKPNKLKIDLDYGKDYLTVNDKDLLGNLEVKWLHGGIAKNLKAEFELVLTKTKTTFKKYESYTFEDQTRYYEPEISSIFNGKLDANGKAKVPAAIRMNGDAPGMLKAHFRGKVYEESGDFSIDQFSIPYYPYESFVGLRTPEGDHRGMLLTDKKQPIDIVCLTPDGVLKGDKSVKIEVFKLDWKWWWDQSSNSSSNYIGTNSRSPIVSDYARVNQGKGQYQLQIDYPSWGRYFVKITDNESGHSAGKIVYFDWPGWAGKAKRDLPDAASMLTFSADKENYKVGETMKLSIPGSGEGNALISIENGSKVLESYWMPLNKGENQFNINITKSMAPNVFVHITALQPHAQTINDHPIRMYGVIPIDIIDETTHLHPVIKMPDQLSPGKNVPIEVIEKEGKPMTFTLAVVDEGLLGLTNYKTPDPWPHFYQHEALGVNTWDLYKYVLGAYGGEIEKILAVGGDGNIMNKDGEKTKRFKPVVRFFGPYHLDAADRKKINFTMPNYIGAVRTMVVAGYEGAYGASEKETPVRQSLMVQGTLPRVLSPGEKLTLPVNVFAYDKNIGKTTVTVKSSGPLTALETSKTVTFTKKDDKMLYFNMEVANQIGISKVEIKAVSGQLTSTHIIDIETRNPNPFTTQTFEKVLQPGESLQHTFKIPGMKGTNSYAIETATVPPLNLSKRLNYLIRYPHGCVEQTTSSVFPQLFLGNLTELTAEMKSRVETNVKKGIERLSSMQHSNGGFKYWPNASEASMWGSNYAGHFLVMAKKKGYYVSSETISDWKKYQKKQAQSWRADGRYNSDLIQAYRLYGLALAGSPERGSMNRLKEKQLNRTAQYMLAAAYALSGRVDVANTLIMSAPPAIKSYREYWYTYGSSFRDQSMLLLALNAVKDTENGMLAVKKISKRLNNKKWLSTQETSFSLLAISDFMSSQPVSSSVNMLMTLNDEEIEVTSQYAVFKKDISEIGLKNKTVSITNTSSGVLYVNLSATGQPLFDKRENSNNVIDMSVSYSDKDGNNLDITELEQNSEFLVSVKIHNNGIRGNLKEMALTTIFPSGWEIQNTRLDVVAAHYQSDKPEYQDIRDDRIHSYFDIKAGTSKTYNFLINASYAGEFSLPAITCEAMYDNAVQAYVKGGKTRTVK